MANTKTIKVDISLIDVFGKICNGFAEKIKREYNLTELFVPHTLASQLLAGKYNGKTSFDFEIKKTGLNKGVLELSNWE